MDKEHLSSNQGREIRKLLRLLGETVPVDLAGDLHIADGHEYIEHLRDRLKPKPWHWPCPPPQVIRA